MAILSDKDIRELIQEKNAVYTEEGPKVDYDLQLGPSSFDLRLGYEFGVIDTRRIEMIDAQNMEKYRKYIQQEQHSPKEGVVIHPGEFILGSTLETLNVPKDLVARVEGRSSYGRLGIIVHASLPYDERILYWTEEEGYRFREIGELVEEQPKGCAVSFDPETQEVERFKVTDFIENQPRDIYRVKTEKGREVRVTKDHNLFTLNDEGEIERIKSQNLEGEHIAVPKKIPKSQENPIIDLVNLFEEESLQEDVMVNQEEVLEEADIENSGMKNYYKSNNIVPLSNLENKEIQEEAKLSFKQSQKRYPKQIQLTPEFAYAAGLFIAEGYQRRKQLIVSNKKTEYLDRVREYFQQFDVGFYEKADENGCSRLTISSAFFSKVFKALGIADKRIKGKLLSMPEESLEQLLQGLIDGDACTRDGRVEYYTNSKELAGDIMYLCSLLGKASSVTHIERDDGRDEYRVEIREKPYKMLQGIPTPSKLLRDTRNALNLSGKEAASELGYSSKTSIHNLESGYYETVKRENLRKIAEYYGNRAETSVSKDRAEKLLKIANSDLYFDKVVEVEKAEENAPNYDLEVQPEGKEIENFLGGYGGVFLSNTAGYVDPGFEGDITLEIQNLGNAPVKIYPEDRVCQVVFETMTSESETHKVHGADRCNRLKAEQGETLNRKIFRSILAITRLWQ
jgi:dCTP deaminase